MARFHMMQLKELVSKVKIHKTIYLPLMEMTSLLLEAYAATGNVPVSSNQAYGMVHY